MRRRMPMGTMLLAALAATTAAAQGKGGAAKTVGWNGLITVRAQWLSEASSHCSASKAHGEAFIRIPVVNGRSGGADAPFLKATASLDSREEHTPTGGRDCAPNSCPSPGPAFSRANGPIDVSLDFEALRPGDDGRYSILLMEASDLEDDHSDLEFVHGQCPRPIVAHGTTAPLTAALFGVLDVIGGRVSGGDSTTLVGSATRVVPAPAGTGSKSVTVTWDLHLGAPAVALSVDGCTDLVVGQSAVVRAQADPPGGRYEYSTDPSGIVSVAGLGASASLTAATPGEATLTVDYTSRDGKKAKATRAVTCVRLASINGGAPVQIGLHDAQGKRKSDAVTVALDVEPAGAGSRLRFEPSNPALLSLAAGGAELTLQGLAPGQTTVKALTSCGKPAGPPLSVSVVPCDPQVIAEIRAERQRIAARLQSNRKQRSELTGDDEFDRAGREVEQHTKDVAQKTAELIAATMAAGNVATEGVGRAGDVNDVYSLATDVAGGNYQGAALSAAIMAIKNAAWKTLAGGVKTAAEAAQAAQQLGQDLGTLAGTADRLQELDEQERLTQAELDAIDARLRDVCKVGGARGGAGQRTGEPGKQAEPGAKSPPQEPRSAGRGAGEQKATRGGQPQPPGGEGPPGSSEGTTGAGAERRSGGGTEKETKPPEPPRPPEKPGTGTVPGGLPEDSQPAACGCGAMGISAGRGGAAAPAARLHGAHDCTESFRLAVRAYGEGASTGFGGTLEELERANQLPAPARQQRLDELEPRLRDMLTVAGTMALGARRMHATLQGCGSGILRSRDALTATRRTGAHD